MKQKITPCLWFDDKAEEAVRFYASVFKDAQIGTITHYDNESAKVSGMPEGSVLTVAFRLFGQEFLALNGGPVFTFTPAVSFVVNCEAQEEIDGFWEKLSAVKEAEQCGWLQDKYGVSWQIVPTVLNEMLSDPDRAKAQRAMSAMLEMKKLDIGKLKEAYEGK